jgi:hypothetical protein
MRRKSAKMGMKENNENQRHRASGLNLLVAAIILWNTTCSVLSITCAIKGTIQFLVIWPICRHSAGSTSI